MQPGVYQGFELSEGRNAIVTSRPALPCAG